LEATSNEDKRLFIFLKVRERLFSQTGIDFQTTERNGRIQIILRMAGLDSAFAQVCLVDAFVYGKPSFRSIAEGLIIFLFFASSLSTLQGICLEC
jgi:hypothetical protein